MKKEQTADQLVEQLLEKVEAKKKEIKKIERPQWKTSCTFGKDIHSPQVINIQVVNHVDVLVDLTAWVLSYRNNWEQACSSLEVICPCKVRGYSCEEWLDDFKTRVDQIQITKKKDELKKLEERLNSLVSPEKRREMELAAIAKELA